MCQLQAFGVKIEPVGRVTVEFVATDGTAETVGVGTVHAQLVCSTGMWIEPDAVCSYHLVVGDGSFRGSEMVPVMGCKE